MTGPAGDGPDFRLLAPEAFDWGAAAAPAPPSTWTEGELRLWRATVRQIAGTARAFAERVPEHAAPFVAFAVTLERRADMGPAGPSAPDRPYSTRPPPEEQR